MDPDGVAVEGEMIPQYSILDDPPCESCGCLGNAECGARPVDEKSFCALDENMNCPCCNRLGKYKNMKRWRVK